MKDKLIIYQFNPPESDSDPLPEEKICKKCLEIESECECSFYDKLEAEELKAIETDRKARPSDIFKSLFKAQTLLINL
jgi:hypothetical protein